jgi:hypothetical protein
MDLTAERGKTGVAHVAERHHGRSIGIHHRNHAPMPALDELTAGDFNENGIGHGTVS